MVIQIGPRLCETDKASTRNHATYGPLFLTIPVVEGLEVYEGADLAVLVVWQVEGVPGREVGCPVQEEELPHSLDLAVQLMKVLLFPWS